MEGPPCMPKRRARTPPWSPFPLEKCLQAIVFISMVPVKKRGSLIHWDWIETLGALTLYFLCIPKIKNFCFMAPVTIEEGSSVQVSMRSQTIHRSIPNSSIFTISKNFVAFLSKPLLKIWSIKPTLAKRPYSPISIASHYPILPLTPTLFKPHSIYPTNMKALDMLC